MIKTIRIAVPWSHITGCVGGNLNCEEVEMAGMQRGGDGRWGMWYLAHIYMASL